MGQPGEPDLRGVAGEAARVVHARKEPGALDSELLGDADLTAERVEVDAVVASDLVQEPTLHDAAQIRRGTLVRARERVRRGIAAEADVVEARVVSGRRDHQRRERASPPDR